MAAQAPYAVVAETVCLSQQMVFISIDDPLSRVFSAAQINFASSIYVLYLAFLVVVTPPFIVYG